jgi:tRNA1Val (adenine37-N6)-methyltransferase
MQDFEVLAEKSGFFPFQKVQIKDSEPKQVYREVCGFSFSEKVKMETELVLKEANGSYSEAYSKLLSGFLMGY